MVANEAKMVVKVANLVAKNDANLALPSRFAFSLNRHYNQDDAFPSSVPGVSRYTIYSSSAKGASGRRLNKRSAGRRRSRPKSIWDENNWLSHEQHSCRQARKRAAFCPSPDDYWIPGERGCSEWSD
ncbi:hypothetical protein TNCV_2107441 [Trichonephila clavipes]|nr:hypothetical protein TNCV_2107441 [Trichonephila clavipes]